MRLAGSVTIKAPRQKVWEFLTDPHKVAPCAPGIGAVEVIEGGKKFRATATIGFGAIKARFTGEAEWMEMDAPRRATIRAHGTAAGSAADIAAEMLLAEGAAGLTELKWTAEVEVMGQLASVASRLMTPVSRKLTEQFFASVKKIIEE